MDIEQIDDAKQVPSTAHEIARTFRKTSSKTAKVIEQQWTDESLKQIQESNDKILMGLIKHIVHHRGQITVLMRASRA
ncbi:hypothetical protein NCCP28_24740 [Niallia sp. NCCP-28]|nr:hypothetical protein NCCP28_24740 [Niallia sp. NCCP-28]